MDDASGIDRFPLVRKRPTIDRVVHYEDCEYCIAYLKLEDEKGILLALAWVFELTESRKMMILCVHAVNVQRRLSM